MTNQLNNSTNFSYNQTEELSNKADSKSTSIMNTTTKTENIMTQEKTSILNAMSEMQDATGNQWAYILEDSGKLYYESVSYTIEYNEDYEEEDCDDEDPDEDYEESSPMTVCCFNSTPKEMATYLPTDVDVIDEKQMAAYMWANHEVLCKTYEYECWTMEDECGILDAIAMQLYYIRQLSPKYYKDNMGFSEPYKSLCDYTYARKRAYEIYQNLQEEARTY
ncbi:hypothetical protein [Duncaniella muris]|uniref:hypothetical protein n=2 Tax=Duncaniella TaxID=2518495 RepID=UPI0025B1243C|nr:hypothetical protein [Duncaniella muris]